MAFDMTTYALLKGKTSSLQSEIDILNGDAETEGSVENKIADAISDSPEEYEKLQQLQDWLDNHSDMEAALIADVADLKTNKQDKLTEGEHITIDGNNVIDVKVDTTIDSTSTNPISNAAVAGVAATLEQVAQTASQAGGTADNAAALASQANSTANEAKTAVAGKQDKLTAGENIKIENNIISATNTGNAKEKEITQAEYDLLSPTQKNNGTTYYITDASSDVYEAGAAINITDGVISVVADDTISGNSTNPIQNKKVAEAVAQLQNKDNQQDGVISDLGTQVSGIQNNLDTITTALNGKQNKLTDSDDITIDQNVIDLSQSFKDGLNSSITNLTNATTANAHNIDLLSSDMEGVAATITDMASDIDNLEKKEKDDVDAINESIATMTTTISGLGNNKQDKFVVEEDSGLVLEPTIAGVDQLRLQSKLNVEAGKGTYITSISSTASGKPADITTYVNAKYSIKQGNDDKYYNYDTETDEYVFPVTDANNITFDSTANADEGTIAEAMKSVESDITTIGQTVGAIVPTVQTMQGQVNNITSSVNSIVNSLGNYLPKDNPKYNGNFGATGCLTIGNKSVAIGNNTTASGAYSIAIGDSAIANDNTAIAIGYKTTANGEYAYAEGYETSAAGEASHAEGFQTSAEGQYSHVEGQSCKACGDYVGHAEGISTTAWNYAHSEGYRTRAYGDGSHAEGNTTKAEANYSHAEGECTTASGNYSHAEGYWTVASTSAAHAQGSSTTASGANSFAGGYLNKALGDESFVHGSDSTVVGLNSNALGNNLNAAYNNQTVIGKYNTIADAAFIVGNGTDSNNLSNAFTVDWNGEAAAADFATTVDDTKYTLTQIISALKSAGILS